MIYQSFSKESVTEKKSRKDIRITLYSSEGRSELENYIRQYYPPGYGALEGEGYVETVTFRQEGPIWYADISIWHDTGLGILKYRLLLLLITKKYWNSKKPKQHILL